MTRLTNTGVWTTEYLNDFLTEAQEQTALAYLRSLPYHHYTSRGVTLKRAMCEFGASYPPTGSIGPAAPIPTEFRWMADLVETFCGATFDQLIVTRYPPEAVIGIHCDHVKWFGEPIAGVSLGGDGILRGTHPEVGHVDQIIRRRSIYVLRGRERFEWRHELRPARVDRCSLTFRILTAEAIERIERMPTI